METRCFSLVASLACGAFLWSGATASTATDAPVPRAALSQPAPGDYVRIGVTAEATDTNQDGIANTGFIVGRSGVAVIDPGGSLADGRALRAAIRATTNLPVRYVIMTHAHPDHVFGAEAFLPDHPVFVGHWRLPAALAMRAAYDHGRLAAILGEAKTGHPVSPSLLVHDRLSLDLGGRKLDLTAFGPAHTDTDLVVLDEASRALWAGDLVFAGRLPSLDGDLKGWLGALGTLETLPASRVIPGHGPASLPWPQGDADEKRYLTLLLRDVRAAIAAGRDIDQAVASAARAERGKWALFDAYNGHNVTVAYKELQWE